MSGIKPSKYGWFIIALLTYSVFPQQVDDTPNHQPVHSQQPGACAGPGTYYARTDFLKWILIIITHLYP